MPKGSFSFKGTSGGLTMILGADDSMEDILSNIERKIEDAPEFFNQPTLCLRYRGRDMSYGEREAVRRLIEDKAGIRVMAVEAEPSRQRAVKAGGEADPADDRLMEALSKGQARFHKGTVRSGMLVESRGHAVVIGDVNPGGEVIADGNIVIMGILKGMAHAGRGGDEGAFIAAFGFSPTLLRIGEAICGPPSGDEGAKGGPSPEIAYQKDGVIYIEPL